MRADILVVEDDREYADLASMYLEGEGVTVRRAESGEQALAEVQRVSPDLILLDINLPGIDGFDTLSEIRRLCNAPVIIVSAREEDEDILTGLSAGADEFVSKPVSPRVLAARVRAMLRRARASESPAAGAGSASAPRRVLTFGPFRFEPEAWLLEREGTRVRLSSRECEVLSYLVDHAGIPQSPETIYREVWQQEFGDLTSVAVYVQRLRRKLGEDAEHPRYIETVFGKGYRFMADSLHTSEEPT